MSFDPIPLFNKEVFAKLGDFVFAIDGLYANKIERETTYRWVVQEPLGAPTIYQYLGDRSPKPRPQEDKMTFSGILYPEYSGRIDQLKKLRGMAAEGKPMRLIYADTLIGENLGMWVLTKIKETRSIFVGDGIPKKIEFTLELLFYG